MDERATRYLQEIGRRLEESLGDRLLGVSAIGSYAMDAYVPGRSDLDVLVVIDRPLTVADWDAVVDGNLGGLFRCCRAVLRGMMTRRRGAIVNIASLSALHGVAGQAAYAASKGGILGLTRSLAREVGKRGVRVNAVVPGFVPTDLTADVPRATIDALRAGECLPGGVQVESVAGAVQFLLSDLSASITGQAIVVDAGASA